VKAHALWQSHDRNAAMIEQARLNRPMLAYGRFVPLRLVIPKRLDVEREKCRVSHLSSFPPGRILAICA
jgi:hypothetical protein